MLLGAGAPLTNSAGTPWTAAYIGTFREPTGDLRSNFGADVRTKIIYERLINVTGDASIRDARGFLDDTRGIAPEVV